MIDWTHPPKTKKIARDFKSTVLTGGVLYVDWVAFKHKISSNEIFCFVYLLSVSKGQEWNSSSLQNPNLNQLKHMTTSLTGISEFNKRVKRSYVRSQKLVVCFVTVPQMQQNRRVLGPLQGARSTQGQ